MSPLAKVVTFAISVVWTWIFLESTGHTVTSLFLPRPIEAPPAPISIFEQGSSEAAALPLETVDISQQHEGPIFTETVYAQTIVTRVFEPTRTVTAWSIVTETRTPIISPVAQPAPVEITRHGYDDLLFVALLGFLLGLASMAFVHWCRQQDELERDSRRRQEPSPDVTEPSNATILERMNAVMEALEEQPARAAPAQMHNIDTARPVGRVGRIRDRGLIEAHVNNEAAANVEAPAVFNVDILPEHPNLAVIGDMQDRTRQDEEARLIDGRSYLDAESKVVDAPATGVTETGEPHATEIAPVKPSSNEVTTEPTAGVAEEKTGDQAIDASETETLQATENALAPAGNEEHEDAADVQNDGDAEADAGGYGEAQSNVAIENAPFEPINNDEHDEPDADDDEPDIDQAIEDDTEQAPIQPQQDNDPARGVGDTESNTIHGEQQEVTPSSPTDDQSGTQSVVNMGEPKETSPVGADTETIGVAESAMQDGPERGSSDAGNALGSGHGDKVDASETLGLRPDDPSSRAGNALNSGDDEESHANEKPRLRPDDPAVAQGEDFPRARRYDPTNAAQLDEDLANLDDLDNDDERERLKSSRRGQRLFKAPRRLRTRQTDPLPATHATNFSPVHRLTELSAPVAADSEMSGVQTAPTKGYPSSSGLLDGPQAANTNEGGDVEMCDDTQAIGQEPGLANVDAKMDEDPTAPAHFAAGSLHTTNAFVFENKHQVVATERHAPDNANTPEFEMRDGPAGSLFTASAGLHNHRGRQHGVATETQQNQPMLLGSSAGVAIPPVSQEMFVAPETQQNQPEALSAFGGLFGRPDNGHKPFATEQQLHQPGAFRFSAGGTSQPVHQHKVATKETQYPQHEAPGSSGGVPSRPVVQHKDLATEARQKASSKAEVHGNALTTKERTDVDDTKEQRQEGSDTDEEDEAESPRMQELRERFRKGQRVLQPMKGRGNGAPVARSIAQKLATPANENEFSPTSEEDEEDDEDEGEALAKKHKRVADPTADNTSASSATWISAILQTRPATTATPPGQFSKDNHVQYMKSHLLIMSKVNTSLKKATTYFGTLGSLNIRDDAIDLCSLTQIALDTIEQNAEWLQAKEQQKGLREIKPGKLPEGLVEKAHAEAGRVMKFLETLGEAENVHPNDLLWDLTRGKEGRSGWRTYADCQAIERTLAVVLGLKPTG